MHLQWCLHSSKRWYHYFRCDQATQVAVKTCASFVTCIIKIDGTTTDDADGLNLVVPMYNLLEYSSNYSYTSGSLWLYCKEDTTDFDSIKKGNNFTFFKYKAKLLKNIAANRANGILTNTATVFYI